jgi:hypothetical protein
MPYATRETAFAALRLKGQDKRRGVRLNSRVQVAIEWKASSGQTCQEKAHTRVVGPHGCLLVFPADIGVEQTVRLTNLATERSSDAIIVWRGPKQADGWEMGIELIEPEIDFWGLEL